MKLGRIIASGLLSLLLFGGLSACNEGSNTSDNYSKYTIENGVYKINKEFKISDTTKLGSARFMADGDFKPCNGGNDKLDHIASPNYFTEDTIYPYVYNSATLKFYCINSKKGTGGYYENIPKDFTLQVDKGLYAKDCDNCGAARRLSDNAVSVSYDGYQGTYVVTVKSASFNRMDIPVTVPAIKVTYKTNGIINKQHTDDVSIARNFSIDRPNGKLSGFKINAPHVLGSNIVYLGMGDKIDIDVNNLYIESNAKYLPHNYYIDLKDVVGPSNDALEPINSMAWSYQILNQESSCDVASHIIPKYENGVLMLSIDHNASFTSCAGQITALLKLYFVNGSKNLSVYDYPIRVVDHRVINVRPVDIGRGDPEDPDNKDYYSSDIFMPLNDEYRYEIPYKITYDDGTEKILTKLDCEQSYDYGCDFKASIVSGAQSVEIVKNDDPNSLITLKPLAKTSDSAAQLKTNFSFYMKGEDNYKYEQESVSDIYISNSMTIASMGVQFSDISYNKESFEMWVGDKRHFSAIATTNDNKKIDFTSLGVYSTVASNASGDENSESLPSFIVTSKKSLRNDGSRVELTGVYGGYSNLHINLGENVDYRYTLMVESAYPIRLNSAKFRGAYSNKEINGTSYLLYVNHPLISKDQFKFDLDIAMSNNTVCHATKLSDCGGLNAVLFIGENDNALTFTRDDVLANYIEPTDTFYKLALTPIHGGFGPRLAEQKFAVDSKYNKDYQMSGEYLVQGLASDKLQKASIKVLYPQAVYNISGQSSKGGEFYLNSIKHNGSATNLKITNYLASASCGGYLPPDMCVYNNAKAIYAENMSDSVLDGLLLSNNYKNDNADALDAFIVGGGDLYEASEKDEKDEFSPTISHVLYTRSTADISIRPTTHPVVVLVEDLNKPRSHGQDSHRYEIKEWITTSGAIYCQDNYGAYSAGVGKCTVKDIWNPKITANVNISKDSNGVVILDMK